MFYPDLQHLPCSDSTCFITPLETLHTPIFPKNKPFFLYCLGMIYYDSVTYQT